MKNTESSYLNSKLTCLICNKQTEIRRLFYKSRMPVYKCQECGLGFAIPHSFDSESYYDASYFNGGRSDGYSDYVGARDVLHNQFRSELRHLKQLGADGGVLIELGCAYGYFLEIAQHEYSVYGLEICEDAVASCNARGLKGVRHGAISLDAFGFAPDADVIVLLDVIEHLPDPKAALEAASAKLRPEGLLLITTGDFSSLCARVMGRHWRLMTPPQHLWFFTPQSLARIGRDLGLEVVQLDHPFKMVPLGLVAYQLCRYLSLSLCLPSWMHRVGLPINLFDAMRVVFRKKSK